jgi:hypothetical protein
LLAKCPDGEIGRHSGLKIRRPETVVGVQVPLRAPNKQLTGNSLRFALLEIPLVALVVALGFS